MILSTGIFGIFECLLLWLSPPSTLRQATNLLFARTESAIQLDRHKARDAQNPSPMVEHTRTHPRLKKDTPPGRREKLRFGTLFVPENLPPTPTTPLFIHFHGATWLPEVAAAKQGSAACLGVQLGSGSSAYARPFRDPKSFAELLSEAEAKSGLRFQPLVLTSWSAGYGAVRAILRVPENYERVTSVLLIDGLHAGYVDGRPGPLEPRIVAEDLSVFVRLARDAAAGKKELVIVHSEIFPGTFASTTETADYLIQELGLKRLAVLKWGPMGMQQLSEVKKSRLQIIGYAGNSAPDHIDQLHAMPEFLKWLDWK